MPMLRTATLVAVFVVLELLAMALIYLVCQSLSVIGLNEWVFPFWLLGVPCGIIAATCITLRFAVKLAKR
jgi:hypothetical protein